MEVQAMANYVSGLRQKIATSLIDLHFYHRTAVDRHDHVPATLAWENPVGHTCLQLAAMITEVFLAGIFSDRVPTLFEQCIGRVSDFYESSAAAEAIRKSSVGK